MRGSGECKVSIASQPFPTPVLKPSLEGQPWTERLVLKHPCRGKGRGGGAAM